MDNLIDRAVWFPSLDQLIKAVKVLDQLYDDLAGTWTGGIVFIDLRGGFLLVVTFDSDLYVSFSPPFESLFPPERLVSITLDDACKNGNRYRAWLGGDIPNTLRVLKLLPC